MPDYDKLLDKEIWQFIARVNASYPEDTATRGINEQREIYDRMCAKFRREPPEGVSRNDSEIEGVPIRIYRASGAGGEAGIVYFHGGGFVVGGLESHDDICAEIAGHTGLELIAVDYRLCPEHQHPAAFEDALTVAKWALERGPVVLVGDSAGGNLAAAVSGKLGRAILGQVLIYPALGGDMNSGSYIEHANAPLLTREDVLFYADIRGGAVDDPTANPLAGAFDHLPPSVVFAAQCDPLYDDAFAYAHAIQGAGGKALGVHDHGLVHGHLRARHLSKRAGESFEAICEAITALAEGRFPRT